MNRPASMARLGFIVSIIAICCCAWYMQRQLMMNVDVNSLLLATEKLMQGGNYLEDFFSPNPPMIMFIYTIPVLLAKLLQLSITIIFPLYVFMLASISFFICYHLVTKIFLNKDLLQGYVFLSVMALVFLILPTREFGQRDHLLVMMTMPYLLVTVCRIQIRAINQTLALGIGIFAGLAIALKPQFLILPGLIESYFMFQRRNLLAWLKPETLMIMLVCVAYTIFLLMVRQDYVTVMLPYLVKNYYAGSTDNVGEFYLNTIILFVYAAFIVHILLNRMNEYKELGTVLSIALIAFTMSYLTQGFMLYYHLIPCFSLAILMLAQLYCNLVVRKDLTAADYRVVASASVGMLILFLAQDKLEFSFLELDPILFLAYTGLFSIILVSALKVKKVLPVVLLVAGSGLFSYLTLATMLFRSQLCLITVISLMLASGLLTKYLRHSFHSLFALVVGVLFFAYPGWLIMNNYGLGVRFKNLTTKWLITFVHTQPPHQSIYALAVSPGAAFSLVNYTDVRLKERFLDGLWMFRGVNQKTLADDKDKNHIVDMVVEDMQSGQPNLVFVEKGVLHFDLLEYSLKNKNFREMWRHYHYLTTMVGAGAYQLDIYKSDKG
jgi:hypothetical protein